MEQNFTLHRGDCIEALRAMPGVRTAKPAFYRPWAN